MTYRLYGSRIKTIKKRITSVSAALVLAVTSFGSALPIFLNGTAVAITAPETIYNALPSVSPNTNYPSLGFQATQTSEFGDSIHLGGTNRQLNTITVGMSDWAKYSDYATDARYMDNMATWSHPVTLTVYGTALNSDQTPTTILAQKTETVTIPWRPASDPTCGSTSNGTGWKEGSTCYNYSGIAFNAAFDFSGLAINLPSNVIIGVSFNTQTYGSTPLGIAGPYNSLNVSIPDNQAVAVGSDNDTDGVYWKTATCGYYTVSGACNVFREDTNWAPNGTVALNVTAVTLSAPTNLTPADGTYTNDPAFVDSWSVVPGAAGYEYRTSNTLSGSNLGTIIYSDSTATQPARYSTSGSTVTRQNGGTPDGTYYWQVRAIDGYGNPGAWSAINKVTVDTISPASVTTTSPKPYYTNATTQNKTLTWTTSSSTDVDHYQYAEYYNTPPATDTTAPNWLKTPITGTSTTDTAWKSNITIYWRVRAVDHAGNLSAWSDLGKIITDVDAPSSTNNLPLLVKGTINVNQVITDNDAPASGKLRIWKLDSNGNPDNTMFWASAQVNVDTNNTVSYTLDSLKNLFGDGKYIANFTSWDKAGNASVQQQYFTVDNTAPIVTDTFDVNMLTGDKVTLSPKVTGETGSVTYAWSFPNVLDSLILNHPKDTRDGSTLDIGPAPKGNYTIGLAVTDQAGNQATVTYYVTVSDHSGTAANPTVLGTSTTSNNSSSKKTTTSSSNNGEVLGTETTAPTQSPTDSSSNSGNVEGANTQTANLVTSKSDTINHSRFLGLGWWWLAVLAALLGFFWILLGKRDERSDK